MNYSLAKTGFEMPSDLSLSVQPPAPAEPPASLQRPLFGPEIGPDPRNASQTILMAERCLSRDDPEGALRQLMRSEKRDGDWYYMQGKVLMALEQYESAHQSFREAVRRSPDNNVYRSGALAAVVAQREAETLHGKVKKAFRSILKK